MRHDVTRYFYCCMVRTDHFCSSRRNRNRRKNKTPHTLSSHGTPVEQPFPRSLFRFSLTAVQAVYKLAMAGEQAGFTLEQMIQILNAGVSVETLLNWIELPLGGVDPGPPRSSRWIK
jgi:hypothetical protein